MLAKAPPDRAVAYPGHEETTDQRTARYVDIAEAFATVALDSQERSLYGNSDKGRAKTASTLLAVALHESGFAHDADVGPCYRGRDGTSSRCDSGRAECLLQVRTDVHTQWAKGSLFASRTACVRAALSLLRRSFAMCRSTSPFAVYAGGACLSGATRGRELAVMADSFGRGL